MFKCTSCKKVFTRKDALSRHNKIHDTEAINITCSRCTQSFTRRDSYQRHVKYYCTASPPQVKSRKQVAATSTNTPLMSRKRVAAVFTDVPLMKKPSPVTATLRTSWCDVCKITYTGYKIDHIRTTLPKQNIVCESKKMSSSVADGRDDDGDDYTVEEYRAAFKSRITSYRIKNLNLDDLGVKQFKKKTTRDLPV